MFNGREVTAAERSVDEFLIDEDLRTAQRKGAAS
jgi:hypothetical protein